jgi:dTDP-glucose 4,6-dehydratase
VPVPHPEWAPIVPSNPYSASKAAQEAIATAYWRTYGVPVTIINCMNLIGERQDPEKFVPMLIRGIAAGEEVTIHGREGDIGTRHYLHARNLADALIYILKNLPPAMYGAHAKAGEGKPAYVADRPDRYNIVGPDRISNLALAQTIAGIVGRPLKYKLLDFHSARPGHDPHYGLAPEKLTKAGWTPPVPFDQSLIRTVRWSLEHPEWLL